MSAPLLLNGSYWQSRPTAPGQDRPRAAKYFPRLPHARVNFLILPGSRVRVPPFPPIKSRRCEVVALLPSHLRAIGRASGALSQRSKKRYTELYGSGIA
jgi:hypothetical protein